MNIIYFFVFMGVIWLIGYQYSINHSLLEAQKEQAKINKDQKEFNDSVRTLFRNQQYSEQPEITKPQQRAQNEMYTISK